MINFTDEELEWIYETVKFCAEEVEDFKLLNKIDDYFKAKQVETETIQSAKIRGDELY